MHRELIALVGAAALLAVAICHAAPDVAAVRSAIEQLNPGLKVEAPRPTPIDGLFQATLDGTTGYVTADGRYFIVGDLFDVNSRRNLTEEARRKERLELLKETDASSAIVFAPPKPAHSITVFTDVECGYCRKLHSEIAQYHERGIAVRYLAYPRSGPDSDSWRTMRAVWCAKDRRDALTRAKRGEKIDKPAGCEAGEVARQYALGGRLGLQGTPMIVLEDGSVVGGYMPADALAARLKDADVQRQAKAK